MRIIVADDNGSALRFLRRVCRQAGHEVVALCDDGRQVVEACARCQPDVLVTDVAMPYLTGGEAAQQAITSGHVRHVIFFTTNTQAAVQSGLRAQVPDCIIVAKTCQEAFLLRALREVEQRG